MLVPLKNPFNLTPSQGPVIATGARGWALELEAEEAESARMVWESGPSVPDWDRSADWLRAAERLLPPASARLLNRQRTVD